MRRNPATASLGSRQEPADRALLILRAASLFLLATFGREKLAGFFAALGGGKPVLGGGLTPLIRALGFPLPGVLALFVLLCESVGAVLVAVGVLARPAAVACAASMAGAFFASLRLEEDPIRALLYLAIFSAIAAAGPGRFSLRARRPSGSLGPASILLRLGIAASVAFLVFDPHAEGGQSFARNGAPWALAIVVLAMLVVSAGIAVRPLGAVLAAVWLAAGVAELLRGLPWYALPVRSALYAFVFAALAAGAVARGTGPAAGRPADFHA